MVASLSHVTCEKIIAGGNIHGMVPLMTPPSDIISIKVFFFFHGHQRQIISYVFLFGKIWEDNACLFPVMIKYQHEEPLMKEVITVKLTIVMMKTKNCSEI